MQKYVNVRSTAETVLPLEIDDYSVTVNAGIKEIHEEATDEMSGGFDGWEIAEQTVYEKNEYIMAIAQKNSDLETEATNLQLALADVYEQILAK